MGVELKFIVGALAAWRVSFLLVREQGPWGTVAAMRAALQRSRANVLSCVKCTGMWISLPIALFVTEGHVERLVTWLGLAGVVALIDEWTRPAFEWQEASDEKQLLRSKVDSDDR